jgi:hypothetical protein
MQPTTIDMLGITSIINKIGSYQKLRLSIIWIMVNRIIPRKCRTKKTNNLLEIAKKGIRRYEIGLDVQNIVQN